MLYVRYPLSLRRWQLDEVYVRVQGEMRYLWRAVDHEGELLESLVTKERDKAAALTFMKKLMKRTAAQRASPLTGCGPTRQR